MIAPGLNVYYVSLHKSLKDKSNVFSHWKNVASQSRFTVLDQVGLLC